MPLLQIVCPGGRLQCPHKCCETYLAIYYCCGDASQQVEKELKRNGFIGISDPAMFSSLMKHSGVRMEQGLVSYLLE